MTATQAAFVHTLFEWGALWLGARLYLRGGGHTLRQLGETRRFAVLFGCIAGAAIGNKAVHWLQRVDQWPLLREAPGLILQGQSIVGGLLGGLIGVELAKHWAGVRESTGDRFVLPVLAGLAFGRIGCFVAGLHDDTYGVPTTLPWGVDFGDGIARHPTQLYDIGFALAGIALYAAWQTRLARVPGLAFKLMLAGYLAWRIAVDALKPVPWAWPGGWSGIQVVCLVALAAYLPWVARALNRMRA